MNPINDKRYDEFISTMYEGSDSNTMITNFDRSRQRITPKKILNVGCGTGKLDYFLEEKEFTDVTGFDISKKDVEIAKKNHPNYKYFVHDACLCYPFEDNTFDIVLCKDVYEHIYCPKLMLIEVLRVMKEDGYCVLRTPNALRMELERIMRKPHMGDAVYQYVSPATLELMIKKLGGNMTYVNRMSRIPPFKSILCKFIKKEVYKNFKVS